MKRKRHGFDEVAAKLQQADEMAAKGMLQSEIAKALGISVMTYHRWRRMPQPAREPLFSEVRGPIPYMSGSQTEKSRIDELQVENSRLRRLVTDLLLEKVRLDEIIEERASERKK